jgi:hypothetical protein
LVPGASWCHQCFVPVTGLAAVTAAPFLTGSALGARPADPGQLLPPPGSVRYSRFQATDVTFGPAGRVMITVLVLVPLAGFIAAGLLADPLAGIGGVVIWGGVIVPKALRDTWRRRPDRRS